VSNIENAALREPFSPRVLRPRQLDALREVGTIGAGAAATALSSLMKRRILIRVPELSLISRSEVGALMPSDQGPAAIVSMKILGDINGTAMLVLEPQTATALAESLLGQDVGTFPSQFDDLAQSTLIEVGNILVGAYMNTLSDFLGLMMIMSVPEFSTWPGGPLVQQSGVSEGSAEQMLHIHTVFEIHEQRQLLNGDMIIVPTAPSLRAILQALRLA
jgi:chemotaxis protein CheC